MAIQHFRCPNCKGIPCGPRHKAVTRGHFRNIKKRHGLYDLPLRDVYSHDSRNPDSEFRKRGLMPLLWL